MTDIKQIKKIVADAKENQNEVYFVGELAYYATNKNQTRHALSDLRTIIELHNDNVKKNARIKELERELNFKEHRVNELLSKGGDV